MDAEASDLLAVTEKLDLLGTAVGRHDVDDDLGERLLGPERDRALAWQADAGQQVSGVLIASADKVFTRPRGLLVEDVEVEGWHVPGEYAGIDRVRPGFPPHVDLLATDIVELLPAGQPLAGVVPAEDRR